MAGLVPAIHVGEAATALQSKNYLEAQRFA